MGLSSKRMNILMRVDAGGIIGLGHYFRSIKLIESFSRRGHQTFILHKESEVWNEPYINKGINRLSFGENNEESITLKMVEELDIHVYFVDTPLMISPNLIEKIGKHALVVFYQNLSQIRHLCDLYFLPSLHQNSDFFHSFTDSTKVYQGLEYFTFNQTIEKFARLQTVQDDVKRIGFITGGSDPTNVLLKLYALVDFGRWPAIDFVFYFGINYLFKSQIPSILPENVTFEEFTHEKGRTCDILVSAFGVSTYEFMYLGIPTIAVGHQESNAKAANFLDKEKGAIMSLGEIRCVDRLAFNNVLIELISNKNKRLDLVKNSNVLLDLQGPERIIDKIEEIRHHG